MSIFNPFAIGFACVAASFVVGTDYVVQSKSAGSHPGAYAFSSYLDSYGIRVDATMAKLDKTRRQSVEARTHLPMEPDGWERHEWDIAAIDIDALTAGMHMVEKMAAKGERRKAVKLSKNEAWEYRRGDTVVRISASFDNEPEPSDTAVAGQLAGTFHPIAQPRYQPYKIVGNVPFLAVTDPRDPRPQGQTLLEARLGDEILIAVAGNAGSDDLRELLEQIDFTNLNLMLSEPLPFLLEGAPNMTHDQQMTLAGMQARALNDGQSLSADMVAAIMTGEFTQEVPNAHEEQPLAVLASDETTVQSEPEEPAATRLQLSGGRTCLSEGSRLCE